MSMCGAYKSKGRGRWTDWHPRTTEWWFREQTCQYSHTINTGEIDATVPSPAKNPKGLNAILNKVPKGHAQQGEIFSQAQRIKKEITNYLDQLCKETDSDPLLWWNIHSNIALILQPWQKSISLFQGQVYHLSVFLARVV